MVNKKVSYVTFRIGVPANTLATAPVSVMLRPMSKSLFKFQMWPGEAVPDIALSGWRMREVGGLLIMPDEGSNENLGAGFPTATHQGEADWSPSPLSRITIDMLDQEIPGPPFVVQLDFYNNTATALKFGGVLITREPVHNIHDLIVDLRKWNDRDKPKQVMEPIPATDVETLPTPPHTFRKN